MSLKDDSILRDERGRVIKGSAGLHRKPEQPDTPLEPLPADPNDFDAAILYVARNFGRKDLPKVGLIGYCASLTERPADFATLLGKALARREDAAVSAGGPGVIVNFSTAPSDMHVDENGKLAAASEAQEQWERRSNMKLTGEPPPSSKLELVHPHEPSSREFAFVDDGDDPDDAA